MRAAALGLALMLQATACFGATCAFAPLPKIDGGREIIVLAEGDSITSGVGSSTNDRSYASLAVPLLQPPARLEIKAVSQSLLGWTGSNAPPNSLYARAAADGALVPKNKGGRVYVLTILIGRNDLVGYYGGLEQYLNLLAAYAALMRGAGWDRIVLGTLLPSAWAPFEAVRTAFNDRVRSPCWANEHGFDAIADFAAIAELGSEDAAKNQADFADGTHPNDAGYALMAPVYAEAINSLRR